ncbi:hypothetical protein PDJAM_G00130920 [Pangasius djambal]|uniref:Uncharacterized protein n=1 Tax=Pangasius djambal TaxID=1691987 RepID=A0ACC5ZCD8_9TELE|nr:hypothetical protein [Pangasius djambal]
MVLSYITSRLNSVCFQRLHVHTHVHTSRLSSPRSVLSFRSRPALFCPKPAGMIIRLGRLTPGYFRLLQRQVAGEVQTQPQDRSLNQIAMMLAIMGLSLSYYSAKQMTEKVQRGPVP